MYIYIYIYVYICIYIINKKKKLLMVKTQAENTWRVYVGEFKKLLQLSN